MVGLKEIPQSFLAAQMLILPLNSTWLGSLLPRVFGFYWWRTSSHYLDIGAHNKIHSAHGWKKLEGTLPPADLCLQWDTILTHSSSCIFIALANTKPTSQRRSTQGRADSFPKR
uniref:Uncharacterized protein n=1 Tax=Chrysemys picta bellii TaxID=8478 RepID=A0A8C3IUQ1_CHRPI